MHDRSPPTLDHLRKEEALVDATTVTVLATAPGHPLNLPRPLACSAKPHRFEGELGISPRDGHREGASGPNRYRCSQLPWAALGDLRLLASVGRLHTQCVLPLTSASATIDGLTAVIRGDARVRRSTIPVLRDERGRVVPDIEQADDPSAIEALVPAVMEPFNAIRTTPRFKGTALQSRD